MKRRLINENCCKDQFMEYNSNHRGVIQEAPCTTKSVESKVS